MMVVSEGRKKRTRRRTRRTKEVPRAATLATLLVSLTSLLSHTAEAFVGVAPVSGGCTSFSGVSTRSTSGPGHHRSTTAPGSSHDSVSAGCNRVRRVGAQRTRLEMAKSSRTAEAEARDAREDVEQENRAADVRAKNDQEWQFFDTARINVKGGDGGDG